jgi:hypothetical protein
MVRRGFVVLTYDPFGQGERGISQRDHRRTELLPVGVAQQAIVDLRPSAAWSCFLARDDVDPARIGMTGASGGGYNSWIVPARRPAHRRHRARRRDQRVLRAAQRRAGARLVRREGALPLRPRAALVRQQPRVRRDGGAAAAALHRGPQRPQLPHPGNRAVAAYGSRLYHELGAPERIRYFEDETEGHGYQKRKREAAYGWFLKWLKGEGDGGPVPEPAVEIPPWDSPELRCFPPGRIARRVRDWSRSPSARREARPTPDR